MINMLKPQNDEKVDVTLYGDNVTVTAKGLSKERVKKAVRDMKDRPGCQEDMSVKVRNVRKIDVLKPDGQVDQTIYSSNNKS